MPQNTILPLVGTFFVQLRLVFISDGIGVGIISRVVRVLMT